MKGTVHYETRGEIALLTIDNPPVNPLSSGVRQGLFDGIGRAAADAAVRAVVLTGAGRAFIAGADISEFGNPDASAVGLGECLEAMEGCPKPIVAAINGTAFGGGLEVALCCDYRVAAASAPVGLPEVKLGLLPGAGGTQRLPRLIGAEKALQFILSGDPMAAPAAAALGIVDAVVEADVVDGAIAFAAEVIANGGAKRLLRNDSSQLDADRERPEIFDDARRLAARRMRGRFAPEMIIQCVEAAVQQDFAGGMAVERDNFRQCLEHPQREALIHIFFSEREVAKIPDVPRETATRDIRGAGVVGCGTMGGGIAMSFANVGIPVTIVEMDDGALERGLGVIRRNYENQLRRGRLTEAELDTRMGLLTGTKSFEALGDADVLIEAIYENIDVKVEAFGKLEQIAKPGAVIASNTSGLDIDRMAAATTRPEDVIGLHFFSPANVMRLLEVIRGTHTSAETIATAMKLGRTLNKVAVLSGNAPGFIGNRMLGGYTRQAGEIILQGATPYQVDNVLLAFGMPMGPFQMNDLVGLDLGWRARQLSGMKPEDVPITARVADKLCALERFGQKTGRGFYIYPEGSRAGRPDPEVVEMVKATSAELGIKRGEISDEEVLKRCLYPLINEGARILDDGIALRPCDIDIVYINGYGFPEVTGGPMFWADQQGLDSVLADLRRFQKLYGEAAWQPAPLLERLVREGRNFASLQQG